MGVSEIIDRDREVKELLELADTGGNKLALLYGRRRVGKTFLLNNLWPAERTLYFTASATSPEINRRVLIEEAARWSGEGLRPEDHPTWRTVFRTLIGMRPDQNIIVVLDEFQYLADDNRGLLEVTSELNAIWEGRPLREAGLLLILSGSSVRTLEALAAGGSPLYGRLKWQRQLQPFDYFDAAKMVEPYSHADKIKTYAAFGGVPKYLSAINTARTIEWNIRQLLLDPHGEVRLQLETILRQEEGLRDFERYQAVLASIGIKRVEAGQIASALGQKVDTALRRIISQLTELGFIEDELNFDEHPRRGLRYRIAEPSLRFYYGMVLPNESAIASAGSESVWRERLAQQVFPAYLGRQVFEDVVRQAYLRHRERHNLPAFTEWSQWRGRDRSGRDAEVDLVARLINGRMLTGSIKFRSRRADAKVYLDHIDALNRIASSGKSWAAEALEPGAPMLFISSGGFKEAFHDLVEASHFEVQTWDLNNLF